jgi:hypothetical protein
MFKISNNSSFIFFLLENYEKFVKPWPGAGFCAVLKITQIFFVFTKVAPFILASSTSTKREKGLLQYWGK